MARGVALLSTAMGPICRDFRAGLQPLPAHVTAGLSLATGAAKRRAPERDGWAMVGRPVAQPRGDFFTAVWLRMSNVVTGGGELCE